MPATRNFLTHTPSHPLSLPTLVSDDVDFVSSGGGQRYRYRGQHVVQSLMVSSDESDDDDDDDHDDDRDSVSDADTLDTNSR